MTQGEGFLNRALTMLESERFQAETGVNWEQCLARFGSEEAVYRALETYVRTTSALLRKMLKFRATNASRALVRDYGIAVHLVKDESLWIACNPVAEAAFALYKLSKNASREGLYEGLYILEEKNRAFLKPVCAFVRRLARVTAEYKRQAVCAKNSALLKEESLEKKSLAECL